MRHFSSDQLVFVAVTGGILLALILARSFPLF